MPYTIYNNNSCGQILLGSLPERPFPTGTGKTAQLPIVTLHNPFALQDMMTSESGQYADYSMMSLDGLLRPISLSGLNNFPRYASYTSGCYNSNSHESLTPVYTSANTGAGSQKIYNLNISRDYLNPLTNPQGYSFSSRHETSSLTGHDIDLIGHPLGLASGKSMVTSLGDGAGTDSYSNDYKLLALRGPLLLTGWGYDTNGKPIPNSADTYANAIQGTFATSGLTDKFLPGFLQKSKTWPVAPIDLRFDRQRGVWVSPPSNQLVIGTATGDIPAGGTANFRITTSNETDRKYFDSSGNVVSTPYFPMTMGFGLPADTGTRIISYYDSAKCEYIPLNGTIDSPFLFQLTTCLSYNFKANARYLISSGCALVADTSRPEIEVDARAVRNEFGTVASGMYGWAQKIRDSECSATNYIIYMERPSRFIEFTTTTPFSSNEANANVDYWWMGKQVSSTVKVQLPTHYQSCRPTGELKGVAVWDERETTCTDLYYNIISIDDSLKMAYRACGVSGSMTSYTPTKMLSVGPGLSFTSTSGEICESNLALALTLEKTPICLTSLQYNAYTGSGQSNTAFSKIYLGNGLLFYPSGDCSVLLDTYNTVSSGTGCVSPGGTDTKWHQLNVKKGLAYNITQCSGLDLGLRMNVGGTYGAGIQLGCGLVSSATGDCDILLKTTFSLNGPNITGGTDILTPIGGLILGSGLSIQDTGSPANCRIPTICLTPFSSTGLRDSPPLLTGVYCSGSGIYGYYTKLQFNEFGQYTGYINL